MVTKEEIMKIAILSKLSVGDDEIDQLTEVESDFDNINDLSNVLRDDEVVPSLDREKILRNAKDSDEGCFMVKNIMK